jgi:hypothetical protein
VSDYEDYQAAIREWFVRLDGYQQESGAAHLTDDALAAAGPIPPLPNFDDPVTRAMARSQFNAVRDAKGNSMIRIAYVSSASARDSGNTDDETIQTNRAAFWNEAVDNL